MNMILILSFWVVVNAITGILSYREKWYKLACYNWTCCGFGLSLLLETIVQNIDLLITINENTF